MSSPSPPALQQLQRFDRSSPGFHDQLANVLYGEEYNQCVADLQDGDLVWLVDYLDQALDNLDPTSSGFRKCLRELRSICGTRAILPTSHTLSPSHLNVGPHPIASGGPGDVYEGTFKGSEVCIKRIRVYSKEGPGKAMKTLYQEAVVWKRLEHPNIVPFLGITSTPLQLVSMWMPGGDLTEHITKYPNADRLGLLCDVAEGLCFLHSRNVIHGNLKGPNILVDATSRARIADFGLATITKNLDSIRSASDGHDHTVRWAAPEILSEQGTHSKEADVFSFAMVMIEAFTGAVPFNNTRLTTVMLMIMRGERPSRPTHPVLTDRLWALMQRCWDQDPHLRPEAVEVSQSLPASVPPAWKQLINDSLSTHERISLITSIFSGDNEVEAVVHLSGEDAQNFVDVVYEVLDSLPQQIRRKCLRSLYSICGHQALLPRSLEIPLCYDPTETPLCHGGFGDVWKCQHNGQEVAVKQLRVYSKDDFQRTRRRFCKEVLTWKALRHPNVLPLLGVMTAENRFAMVSEWMEDGSITEFVKVDVTADRLKLLGDVTRGLIYMHGQGIIHGNLKGVNILIDRDGHACLADFSLVAIISDQRTFLSSHIEGGTTQWMSPELLDPEMFGLKKSRTTKQSDCYALGMVIYEVLSGQTPFAPSRAPVVIRKVLKGERPERPQGSGGELFTDSIWRVVELCWEPQPRDRISAEAVLLGLEGNPTPSRPSSNVDGGAETDRDDLSDTTASDSELPIARSDDRLQVPPNQSLHEPSEMAMVLRDGDQLPIPLRMRKRDRVFKLAQKIPGLLRSLYELGQTLWTPPTPG